MHQISQQFRHDDSSMRALERMSQMLFKAVSMAPERYYRMATFKGRALPAFALDGMHNIVISKMYMEGKRRLRDDEGFCDDLRKLQEQTNQYIAKHTLEEGTVDWADRIIEECSKDYAGKTLTGTQASIKA